jgi:hypothetical protein
MTTLSGADGYAVNAQYYDLIFPAAQRDGIRAALTTLLAHSTRVLEVGSGTGLFTQTIVANLAPGGEMFAVEPAAVMRAALTTRLTMLDDPPVTVIPESALAAEIDGPLDGLVLLNVLTHFSPADRKALWNRWCPGCDRAESSSRTCRRRRSRHRSPRQRSRDGRWAVAITTRSPRRQWTATVWCGR